MYDSEQGGIKELTFTLLLLNHLNRISRLSCYIPGEIVTSHYTHNTERDKRTAFMWSVKVLEGFIPAEMYDDEFDEDYKEIEELEKKHPNYPASVDYHHRMLNLYVNLLGRNGILLEKRGISQLIPKKKEAEEEFEE